MLALDHVTKAFGGVRAVDDCHFEIQKKRITALIGPNGAGKSTVFNLVSGVETPDAGNISFVGRDITHVPVHTRARLGISRTFQTVRLFKNLTVYENLAIVATAHDENPLRAFLPAAPHTKSIEAALHRVGFDAPHDRRAAELSYGQQKLLSLARALLLPHALLLLDEPVAGVNPVLRERFKELFNDLKAHGETLLIIEHDMDFVMGLADRVIVMDAGRVLTEGPPSEVQHDPRVLEAYLGEQI